MAELVYFDACLFIELLQQTIPDRFNACEAIRARAVKKELVIVTSALTITEVNKLPESKAVPADQSRKILDFFENEYIAIRPLDRGIAEYSHELTRTHGLHNADAIHVATAVRNKVSVLYTYDAVKQRRKGLLGHNLKVGNPPLRIEKPPDPDKGTLFDEAHVAAISAHAKDDKTEKPQG